MHEISLLENVREILQDHAKAQNFSQVTKITLEIGQLSCVEPSALRFGFDAVMKGSLAENAELILTTLVGLGLCEQCKKQVSIATLYEPCELCGHLFVTITQGNEMKIKDLIVI